MLPGATERCTRVSGTILRNIIPATLRSTFTQAAIRLGQSPPLLKYRIVKHLRLPAPIVIRRDRLVDLGAAGEGEQEEGGG